MITRDTLELEIERNPDGSLLWRDFEGRPLDEYFDHACASAMAMSTKGRFRFMVSIPPADVDDIDKIAYVLSSGALHMANHPQFIAHGIDARFTQFMEQQYAGAGQ